MATLQSLLFCLIILSGRSVNSVIMFTTINSPDEEIYLKKYIAML